MARSYTVPVQDSAVVGDILVVGIYGTSAVGATPAGWTVLASVGTLCALYSHTVASGEVGTATTFDFPLSGTNKVACFVLNVQGSTGVTGRLQVSAGAVASLPLTVSASLAPLIIAGCFSTLSQDFTSTLIPPAQGVSGFGNGSGTGTHCPSVVMGPTVASALVTFNASLSSALVGFELDFSGSTPAVYCQLITNECDLPPSSPNLSQQTVGNGGGTTITFASLTLSAAETCGVVVTAYGANNTVTVSDNNGGSWNHGTGFPIWDATNLSGGDISFAIGHNSGATVTKVTFGASTTAGANFSTYTGVATASALDTQNSHNQNANASPWATGLVTTAVANELLVGCACNASGATTSSVADNGSGGGTPTLLTPVTASTPFDLGAAWQVAATAGSTYQFNFTFSGTCEGVGLIIALKPLPLAGAPLSMFSGHRRRKNLYGVRRKHSLPVRPLWKLPLSPPQYFPPNLRRQQQKKRVPIVKAKQRSRNCWLTERQVTAPHADFPQQLRRQQQKKRIFVTKPKQRSRNTWLNERTASAQFPQIIQRGRQKHRIFVTKPKLRVRNTWILEHQVTAPHADFPPILMRRQQPHRIPKVRRTRLNKNRIELSNLSPPITPPPPLPIFARKAKRRPVLVKAKRRVRGYVFQPPPPVVVTPPLPIFTRKQKRRPILVKAKRSVKERLLQPTPPQSALIRGRIRPKRTTRTVSKRRVKSQIFQPQQPVFIARYKGQPKRLVKIKAKRVVRERWLPPPPPLQSQSALHPIKLGRRVVPKTRRVLPRGKKSWILPFYGTVSVAATTVIGWANIWPPNRATNIMPSPNLRV